MILQHLDMVIGFVSIMLALSLIVTMLVQVVATRRRLRENSLHWGIQQTIERLAPEFAEHSETLATQVLNHPSVRSATNEQVSAISFEELVEVLTLVSETLPANQRIMEEVDLVDRWNKVREQIDAEANPTQKTKLSREERIFTSIMDRATERFTNRIHKHTVFVAIIVAVIGQIDAVNMIETLAQNDQVRSELVAEAIEKAAAPSPKDSAQPPEKDGVTEEDKKGEEDKKDEEHKKGEKDEKVEQDKVAATAQRLESLVLPKENALRLLPIHDHWSDYFAHFSSFRHLLGIALTAILLSFGGPFWFNALRQLVSLRPLVAEKLNPKKAAKQSP